MTSLILFISVSAFLLFLSEAITEYRCQPCSYTVIRWEEHSKEGVRSFTKIRKKSFGEVAGRVFLDWTKEPFKNFHAGVALARIILGIPFFLLSLLPFPTGPIK